MRILRNLRHQLIALLEVAQFQHQMQEIPLRLMAALVHDLTTLLPHQNHQQVAQTMRTFTRDHFHRHIFCLRCPDQAFYLDAIHGYLHKQNIRVLDQQTMVLQMQCDDQSCSLELKEPSTHDEDNFMFIALHFSATLMPDPKQLEKDLRAVLKAVDLTVRDFKPMQQKLETIVSQMKPDESAGLLGWMIDQRYLYFGLIHDQTRLGLARNRRTMERIAPGLKEQIEATPTPEEQGLYWLSLTAGQHYLYSASHAEILRIVWQDDQQLWQQAILIGHFSRAARFTNCSQIPLLFMAWQHISQTPLFRHSAFYRREVRTLYDRIPNRLLLSTHLDDWVAPLKQIVDLADPLATVVHWLPAQQGNMNWLLVSFSADRYGPTILRHLEAALSELGLHLHGYESFALGTHRVICFGVAADHPAMDVKALNHVVRECISFWKDHAKAFVLSQAKRLSVPRALKMLEQIPEIYQQIFPPEQFIHDMQMLDELKHNSRTQVSVHISEEAFVIVDIYSLRQISLGNMVDRLRALGLDPVQESAVTFPHQNGHQLTISECEHCMYISRLSCRSPNTQEVPDKDMLQKIEQALDAIINQEADHDPLNAAILSAGLDVRAVGIVIALRNFLTQLLPDAAVLPLTHSLLRFPRVTHALYECFTAIHLTHEVSAIAQAKDALRQALEDVTNISDDRWFRALYELIKASLRTNAYVRDANTPLAIKFASRNISFAPNPKPYREIFVHDVHMEGVHLRAGPIARGGIRYSDRPSDFRTEILDLMRTQTIKNGQIIPTGSKGGFALRHYTSQEITPDIILKQYRRFIRGLLSLTDNQVFGQSMPPDGIHIPLNDADDAYLVVAADKGTARFSDDANEESRLAGFWLDDAFASGGKHGYDHKVVGITARGAWVCTAHHFEAFGINAWQDPITCVGIGGMNGDVFGNGMLLNPELKLVAAFDHQHIFIDPNPDVAAAWKERKRLFDNVYGWDHYNTKLISHGGGLFQRQSKSISISDATAKILGIEVASLSGPELIRAILKAPVDLLYNGGIGTYVKASGESHADVMDRANDSVRVNASELRCKVVCEGGNLGMTQRARIEFAEKVSPHINTDATDNSAGVDMSDHEVNLKVLFSSMPKPLPLSRRNQILRGLTDAVTEQCLNNNLEQSRVITLAAFDANIHRSRLQRLRHTLQKHHWLDDAVAPRMNEDELLGLRPQLSILLGQEKNRIHAELIDESFDQRSQYSDELLSTYFPAKLHRRFGSAFQQHPLKHEIICTQASNRIVNDYGLCSLHHLQSLLQHPLSDIAEIMFISDTLLEIQELRDAIWQQVSDFHQAVAFQHHLQGQMRLFAEGLLRLCSAWDLKPDYIQTVQKQLRQFRNSTAAQGFSGNENHRFLTDMKQASQAGLSMKYAVHLAALPEISGMACAIYLSLKIGIPLQKCLKASQMVLHLLPIQAMEAQLRSPVWGSPDAHALRREWLHRLSLAKSRAVERLLLVKGPMQKTGETLWHEHPYWPELAAFSSSQSQSDNDEAARMRLLLALTRLETMTQAE